MDFLIQATSYAGKLLIHPSTVTNFHQFLERATIGPIPGQYVLAAGTRSIQHGFLSLSSPLPLAAGPEGQMSSLSLRVASRPGGAEA